MLHIFQNNLFDCCIVLENIIGSIAIKIAVMALVGFGFAGMWLAVFADVGVSLLAVLNSLRTMINKKWVIDMNIKQLFFITRYCITYHYNTSFRKLQEVRSK